MSRVLDLVSLLHKARWCLCQFLYCQAGLKQLPIIKLLVLRPRAEEQIEVTFPTAHQALRRVAISVLSTKSCPLLRRCITGTRRRGLVVQPVGPCRERRSPWAWGHLALPAPLPEPAVPRAPPRPATTDPGLLAAPWGVWGMILGFFPWGTLSQMFCAAVKAVPMCFFTRRVSASAFFCLSDAFADMASTGFGLW